MSGWVKLYRNLQFHPRARDPHWLAVWVYLLLNATHQVFKANFDGKVIELQPGQLITGRLAIARATGVSSAKVYRILKTLKIEQQIEQQAGVKGSMFTVVNWQRYQESEQQSEQRVSSDRAATEQLLSTNKKVENKRTQTQKKSVEELPEALNNESFKRAWEQWKQHLRDKGKGEITSTSATAVLEELAGWGFPRAVAAIKHSIKSRWVSIHEATKAEGRSGKPRRYVEEKPESTSPRQSTGEPIDIQKVIADLEWNVGYEENLAGPDKEGRVTKAKAELLRAQQRLAQNNGSKA